MRCEMMAIRKQFAESRLMNAIEQLPKLLSKPSDAFSVGVRTRGIPIAGRVQLLQS